MYEEYNNNDYREEMYQTDGGFSPERRPEGANQKKGSMKKGIRNALIYGLCFGLSAGCAFQGISLAGEKLAGNEEAAVSGTEKTDDSTQEAQQNSGLTTTAQALQTGVTDESSSDKTVYTVSEIADNCMSSIVSITNTSEQEIQYFFGQTTSQESTSCGSGIIVGENDSELLIATNNHVVEGADSLSVCFNDNEEQVYDAQMKGTDSENDLAIVAIELSDIPEEVMSQITVATLGNSDSLSVGDQVVAIGNALGYGQSVTSGYVSALNREVTIDQMTASLIQTDAAINPGNSGGALFNMYGEVIGINSAKFASSEVEGMGYAIPVSTAEPILSDLENRTTRSKVEEASRGSLGISCISVSEEVSKAYNIPTGVYVSEIASGSAAENAGLQSGDVIVRFDGTSISDTTDLTSLLEYYSEGETVEVVFERKGDSDYQEQTVEITLGSSADTTSDSGNGGNAPADNNNAKSTAGGFFGMR